MVTWFFYFFIFYFRQIHVHDKKRIYVQLFKFPNGFLQVPDRFHHSQCYPHPEAMDTPFEIPYCILEDAPENRHTRILRPYVEQLIHADVEHPVHSNPYNRFSVLRNEVQEETLEYWISDSENEQETGDKGQNSGSESDTDSVSDQKPKKGRRKKKNNSDAKANAMKAQIRLAHDAQISSADSASNYEFNSREVQHIKQQMYLSLQQKSRSTLPPETETKDIKMALISLSGYECPPPSVYFNSSRPDCERVSFIKYLSRVIDTLFYISLYKGNWKQCYRLFSILVRTFDSDINQIWTLGVHMLCELNMSEFKKYFHVEWMKFNNKSAAPELSPKVLNDMAFLQNPALVPLLYKGGNDPDLIRILQRTVVQKRPMYDIILKFLRLLIRTSRNQHPLIGAYPEQTYVPGGILLPEKKLRQSTSHEEPQREEEARSSNSRHQDRRRPNASPNENLDSTEKDAASNTGTENEKSDTDTDSDTDMGIDTDTASTINDPHITISAHKTPIVINNNDFDPRSDGHIPHQQIFRKSLKRHSTPLHKQGTRVRTPTFTLSYLWILVRSGRLNVVQRALEPLLLVVPTSTDARVELANLASRVLDLAGAAHEISLSDEYEWERISLVEGKLSEIEDCWQKWKDQFTSRSKKRRKGVRQFEGYNEVGVSLAKLKEWVNDCLMKNKGDQKSKFGSKLPKPDESCESAKSDGYITANEDDKTDEPEEEVKEDVELDADADEEEEIRKEMERLLGYSAMVDEEESEVKKNELKKEEFGKADFVVEDDDEEEVQREMERLMGYAEEHNNGDDDDDDDNNNFKSENEQFYNEYNKWHDIDSDSE